MTNGGNQLSTAIPATAAGQVGHDPGAGQDAHQLATTGNKRTDYVLGWDVRQDLDGSWLSAGTGAIPALKQNVAVEEPTSDQLGLEKFYSYAGKNTGAGATVMNNLASGNTRLVVQRVHQPGPRACSTFVAVGVQLAGHHPTPSPGYGWSLQAVGADPARRAAGLPPQPEPDGDHAARRRRHHARVHAEHAATARGRPRRVSTTSCTMKSGLDCKPDQGPGPGRLDADPAGRHAVLLRLRRLPDVARSTRTATRRRSPTRSASPTTSRPSSSSTSPTRPAGRP